MLFAYFEPTSSPYINHFIQPDSIIPDLSNPQSLNRFSYVQNNPVRYSDPTGHCIVLDEKDGCYRQKNNRTSIGSDEDLGLKFSGDWDANDKKAFRNAANREAQRIYDVYCPPGRYFYCDFDTPADIFAATHGTTTLTASTSSQKDFYCQRNANRGQEGVTCYSNSKGKIDDVLASHELGHVFNALIANNGYTTPYSDLEAERKNNKDFLHLM